MKRACSCRRAAAILTATTLAALAFTTCDDFNRPLKEEIGFYLSVTPVSTWAELKSAAEGLTGPDLIGLAADITPGSTDTAISITRPLTITAFEGSRTIRREGATPFTGSFFTVDGGDLTLGHPQGGSLILDGGADNGTTVGPLVRVNSGRLTVNSGVTLRNNSIAAGSGGGVHVMGIGSTFTMSGGTISGNTAASYGGGVHVMGIGSTFTMSGGTISGNTATAGYGGGGGVYVNSGDFTMDGGTISGNTVSDTGWGGGVYVYDGAFTMSGGIIGGNTAGYGGGVFVESDFIMSGGTISGNTTSFDGGGVYVYDGSFSKTGGVIFGDTDRIHTPGSDENTAASGSGHAAYMFGGLKRNSTAGPDVNLNSSTSENWE